MRHLIASLCLLLPLYAAAGPMGEPEPELRARLAEAISVAGSFDDRYEAQVWLIDYSARIEKYMPDERQRLDFLQQVHAEAKRAKLPPELVLSVIHIESRFDRHAVSYAGALGYMQIMPFWLTELGQKGENLFKASINLRMGCTILRFYLDKEHGNTSRALARYNGSLGSAEYPNLVLDVQHSRYFAF